MNRSGGARMHQVASQRRHSLLSPQVRARAADFIDPESGEKLVSASEWDGMHVHVVSVNNFPTAAGLASSAAGCASPPAHATPHAASHLEPSSLAHPSAHKPRRSAPSASHHIQAHRTAPPRATQAHITPPHPAPHQPAPHADTPL